MHLDNKIYTTILKNRMQKTLDTIISKSRWAIIKKRTILHLISSISDASDTSTTLGKQFAIISLDFLKAFDRVDWDLIFSAFVSLVSFENKCIHMIQVAHTNISSKIKINGPLSDLFTLIRGVFHGSLLSILLYIIAAEVLDADARIKGVQIKAPCV